MNLIDIFLNETSSSQSDTEALTSSLKEYYEGATQMQQAAINETFILLCGQSYETLLEMEHEVKCSSPKMNM